MPLRILSFATGVSGLLMALMSLTSSSQLHTAVVAEATALRGSSNPQSESDACPAFGYTQGEWVAAANNGYAWRPSLPGCRPRTPEAVSSNDFCNLLQGRSVLLVGDSMSQQHFRVLGDQLEMKKPQRHAHGFAVGFSGKICGSEGGKLTFLRDDYLGLEESTTTATSEGKWWKEEVLNEYDILLLNTGAHPVHPNDFQTHLEQVQERLQQSYQGTVFWRTTPRGHIGCSANETPNHADAFLPSSDPLYQDYHYDWIHENNRIYRQTIPAAQLLDVAPITEQRPDGHSNPPQDCLHYDATDVFEAWSGLFYTALFEEGTTRR